MIKAIIVDDEERARKGLKQLLEMSAPEVEVVAMCANVPDAVIAINQHQPEVVFLDVEMPQYSGLQIGQFFPEMNFHIIFVTAYSEYAIRAFELSAVDYLLKPVQPEKLEDAIRKLKARTVQMTAQRIELAETSLQSNDFNRIALPVSDGFLFVEIKDIMLLEADGAYTKVYLQNGSELLVSKRLLFFEKVLEDRPFMVRVHRSYLVNFNFVKRYSKAESVIVLDNGKTVSVPKEKKAFIEDALQSIKVG
jgi:two-component system LytT family response regulator